MAVAIDAVAVVAVHVVPEVDALRVARVDRVAVAQGEVRGRAAVFAVSEELGGAAVLPDGIARVEDEAALEGLLAFAPMARARPVGDLDGLAVTRTRDVDAVVSVEHVEHGAVGLEIFPVEPGVPALDDPIGAALVLDVVPNGVVAVRFGEGLEVFDKLFVGFGLFLEVRLERLHLFVPGLLLGGAGRGAFAERLDGVGVGVVGLDVGLCDGRDLLVGEVCRALDAFAQDGVRDEDVFEGELDGLPHDGVGGIGVRREGRALERTAHERQELLARDLNPFTAGARDLRPGGAAPNVAGQRRGALGLDVAHDRRAVSCDGVDGRRGARRGDVHVAFDRLVRVGGARLCGLVLFHDGACRLGYRVRSACGWRGGGVRGVGLHDDDGGLVFGVEAEGLLDEGVGFFGELGVGVVVLPAVVEGLELLDGALDAGGVVGAFDVVLLEEGVFCGDVAGLLAGDDLEGAEVEVDLGDLVSGVLGAEGHFGVEGFVGAEEVVLPDGVGLGAFGVFCADAVGHDFGLVGAEALVDDGADDVVLDGVVSGGLSGEGAGFAGGGGDGDGAADGGGDVWGDALVAGGDEGDEVVAAVHGDLEGESALGSCEEAVGLGDFAGDAGFAEEGYVVGVGSLLVEDVVEGVEEGGGLGRPAVGLLDDVCGDGLEAVSLGEVEAVSAGDDLEGAVELLEDDDGLGGDLLEFAVELFAGDDAGVRVCAGLELLDVDVDQDVGDADVVDLGVGGLEELVQ